MSANGKAAAQRKVCPVCQDPFDTVANVPKIFGVCGHSVCAVCVPGCIRRPPGLPGRAKCPLCRQDTPLPPKGLPTNYDLKDTLETQQADIDAANVKCSGCDKNAPTSDAYACKTCTASEKTVVVVCAGCGMKAHRAHEVVDYDALISAKDIETLMRHERQHNDMVLRHTEELTSLVANEMKRIAKECQVDVDANRPLSLMTKEEHDSHAKKSSDRRLQRTRALDAVEEAIIRCRKELCKIRADDAQTSVGRQSARKQKRSANSTDKKQPGPSRAGIKIARRAPTPLPRSRLLSTSSESESDSEEPMINA